MRGPRRLSLCSAQQAILPISIALAAHTLLFLYDVQTSFAAFGTGDRGMGRWITLETFARVRLDALTGLALNDIPPGEIAFVYPAYALAGPPGVIIFQIGLALISVACVTQIATSIGVQKRAADIIAIIYSLLPQSLCYPHQLVSEAIASPFIKMFLLFVVYYLVKKRLSWLFVAGFFLGLAIYSRIALLATLPALVILWTAYAYDRWYRGGIRALSIVVIALAPLLLWSVAFQSVTGRWGYTSSTVSTAWNLRSKIFLVSSRNGITKPPEVAAYTDYHDFDHLGGGVEIRRFAEIAKEHPVAYLKAALFDSIIVWSRGNTSKLFVDYRRFGSSDAKGWRDRWERQGFSGLLDWGLSNPATTFIFVAEVASSFWTISLSVCTFAMIELLLLRPNEVTSRLGIEVSQMLLAFAALIIAVEASALIIDQAQGRFRQPVEAAMLITAFIFFRYIKLSCFSRAVRRKASN